MSGTGIGLIGGGSKSVITVDRFANVLPTIIVKNPSNTLDWNSYDYADLYLSKLLNPPVGAQEAALFTFYDNMIAEGILQKAKGGMWLFIGGSAADHKWNGAYPFDKRNAGVIEFVGTPTHDANGVTTNGTTQACFTRTNNNQFDVHNYQLSIYKRNTTAIVNTTATAFGFNLATSLGTYFRPNINGVDGQANCNGTNFTAPGMAANNNGLISLRNDAALLVSIIRNGVIVASGAGAGDVYGSFAIGAAGGTTNAVNLPSPVNCCYAYHGEKLTALQETNHYAIVQALQLALGRQV